MLLLRWQGILQLSKADKKAYRARRYKMTKQADAQPIELYPLLFEPALHARVWGGKQLETRLGKHPSTAEPVGESWEIYFQNRVSNGALHGKTLGELIAEHPKEIVGSPDADPEFPLLIKFLDSRDWLSVQVHPDDALAEKLEGQPRGKTECWYIIDAVPNAEIIYGLNEALNEATFRQAIESGHTRDVLQSVPVKAGDFVYVPAGTVHALGPGILLYELQQTSDTTYRVYDWDRLGLDGKPRALHIDKSLACTHYDVRPKAQVDYKMEKTPEGYAVASLVKGPFFALDKLEFNRHYRYEIFNKHIGVHALTVLRGSIMLRDPQDRYVPVTVATGQSVLMPDGISNSYIVSQDSEAEVLRASLPRKA
jgi:mannose-6-phosphate isomerase